MMDMALAGFPRQGLRHASCGTAQAAAAMQRNMHVAGAQARAPSPFHYILLHDVVPFPAMSVQICGAAFGPCMW